jgi:hypothetical protein
MRGDPRVYGVKFRTLVHLDSRRLGERLYPALRAAMAAGSVETLRPPPSGQGRIVRLRFTAREHSALLVHCKIAEIWLEDFVNCVLLKSLATLAPST